MSDYRFERLSKENLKHLVLLYNSSFNLATDVNYLEKKYNTSAFGAAYIGFLAFHNQTGQAAAYYGVFPILVKLNNTEILAAQSGDTMTHPKHQGKGLFTILAKMTYELAEKENINFVFGFPNKNSYPGFVKKLSWQHYNDINNYVITTNTLPFDKIAKKMPLFGSLYNSYINARLKKIICNELPENSISKQDPKMGYVIHDERFYKYKTYTKTYSVKLNEITCVIKIDGRLWVGDISYCSKEKFLDTVNNLVKLAKKLNCASVHFSFFNDTLYDQFIKEKAQIKSKNPVGALPLKNNIDVTAFAFQAIDFDTF